MIYDLTRNKKMELPHNVHQRMSIQERKHWSVLKYKDNLLKHNMLKVQGDYCEMARYNPNDRRLPLIADKGFKYESLAIAAAEKLKNFYDFYSLKYLH